MATAPEAIQQLYRDIAAKWTGPGRPVLSGIVGDAAHSFGFHLSPTDLRSRGESGDYSLQGARNKAGALANPGDASALDVSFDPDGMKLATTRLLAAAKARDPRLDGLFEFCGTTNGSSPHPYYLSTHTDDPTNSSGWDDSHVWHVHLSIWRDASVNYDAIKGIADVICGISATEELTMDAEVKAAFDALNARLDALPADVWKEKAFPVSYPKASAAVVMVGISKTVKADLEIDKADAAQDATP